MRTPHKFDRFLIPPNPSSIVSNITLLHIYQSYLPILLVDNGSSRDNCKSGTSRTAQSRRQNRDCTKLVHRPSFSGLSAKHRPAYGEVSWRMLTQLGVCIQGSANKTLLTNTIAISPRSSLSQRLLKNRSDCDGRNRK